jgi:glycerol transport system ATP-binding protein
VTHDQTEALTFADQVVVMSRGKAVQVGSADALFQRPAHTFVGHFIGSPGMNFLPARWRDGFVEIAGRRYTPELLPAVAQQLEAAGEFKVGVRPEYVRLAADGDHQAVPARIQRAQDIGTYWLATATLLNPGETVAPPASAGTATPEPVDLHAATLLRARLASEAAALRTGETAWFSVFNRHTCYYVNEELVQ